MSQARPALVALVLGAACTDEPESVVEVATVRVEAGGPVIVHPMPVTVGEPFALVIGTEGDGCHAHERTDVDHTEDGHVITPYHRRSVGRPCPAILQFIEHTATLAYDAPGTKRVRVRSAAADTEGTLVEFDLAIDVAAAE